MFYPHVLAQSFLLVLGLVCLSNAIAFGQTQAFTLDPGLPPKIAIGDQPAVKVKVTPVSGGALPSIDNIQFNSIAGLLKITSKLDEGAGVYSFMFKTAKLAGVRTSGISTFDSWAQAAIIKKVAQQQRRPCLVGNVQSI